HGFPRHLARRDVLLDGRTGVRSSARDGFGRSRGLTLAASAVPRYAAAYEPALRADEDQRVRADVGARGEAWRGEPRPGLSRFRLARRDPRRRGAGAQRAVEPIPALRRPAGAARGSRGSL